RVSQCARLSPALATLNRFTLVFTKGRSFFCADDTAHLPRNKKGSMGVASSLRLPSSCSSRCPAADHLRPAVSAVVLGKLHLIVHAIGVPVNPERGVADATRNAVFIPSGLSRVVPACDEH